MMNDSPSPAAGPSQNQWAGRPAAAPAPPPAGPPPAGSTSAQPMTAQSAQPIAAPMEPADLITDIEGRVREQIRQRSVDPFAQGSVVRHIIDDVLAGHA
ncbi:MAG: hypothetical protein ACRDPW_08895, partial [Mycobacteriales bacterium]